MKEDITTDLKEKMSTVNFNRSLELSSEKIQLKKEILNNYKLIMQIGKGLFSKVYLGLDPQGNKVGIKVIMKRNFTAVEAIEKIIIEKEILKRMNHRNILKLYNTFQTNSKIYFILEYADKGNLLQILNLKLRMSVDEIRIISAQIIDALLYIHSQNIIYGDLKAENVLVNRKGLIKLCDFNLSGTSTLLCDTIQGTATYLAPEILENKERTPKSDFWALGVMVHLLYYRKFPFEGPTQRELFYNIINSEIPAEPRDLRPLRSFRQFVTDLLVKNPKRRLGNNMKEFVSHPFFEGFEWKTYLDNPKNFSYIDKIESFEDMDRNKKTAQVPEDGRIFSSGHSNQFIYNIDNFTYENDDRVLKAQINADKSNKLREKASAFN